MGKGGKGKGKTTKVWTEPKKWESKGKGKASEGEDGRERNGPQDLCTCFSRFEENLISHIGHLRRAAPLKSEFWNKKVEAEGRKEMGDTVLPGVIQRYSFKQGASAAPTMMWRVMYVTYWWQ
eukprot:g8645.t1